VRHGARHQFPLGERRQRVGDGGDEKIAAKLIKSRRLALNSFLPCC